MKSQTVSVPRGTCKEEEHQALARRSRLLEAERSEAW